MSSQEIIARCLTREDLFKFEHTGYFLGKKILVPAEVIQAEMNRRAKYSPKWYLK